jgi:hypothetical protein
MDELPQDVQDELMNSYLYKSFIKAFKFSIPCNCSNIHARYTWTNLNFRNMMVGLMQNLEPITFQKDEILINELDPHLEIFFIMNDYCEVGFSINHQMIFNLQLMHSMIGAYGVTYNKNSHYIYKVSNNCKGFFVRRIKWLEILDTISVDTSDMFVKCFKQALKEQYEDKINKVLHRCKVKETTKMQSRFNSGIISLNVK